ncbi:unnamed protein product, partial [Brassica oleracea]
CQLRANQTLTDKITKHQNIVLGLLNQIYLIKIKVYNGDGNSEQQDPFLFEKKKKIIENQSIVRLLKPRNTKRRSINTLNLYVAFATKTKKKGTTLFLAGLATYDSA